LGRLATIVSGICPPWNRYADGVSPKKRNSRKRKTHRQGLSGNPQRRAEQLRQAEYSQSAFLDLAYRLAGGVPVAPPWWRESHERILARARALTWPSRLADLETQTCQIVGDEFYDRLQSPGTGFHPAQWLRALAEEAGAALRTALAEGADDWQQLWALLCGLALTAPQTPADAVDETARELFPDIKDPHETALAEADQAAKLLADRGLEPVGTWTADGSRATGEPLAARDVYGSRFLLVAPFGYGGDAPDHWYAWDIDFCWIETVVGAGVFASAEDALREWRGAVGPTASAAALSPCAPGMTAQLLASCLVTGAMADMLEGSEPRELIREYYRLRRRARDLTGSADPDAGSPSFDVSHVDQVFLGWYAAQHDDIAAKEAAEALGTILEEWGPGQNPDERAFYGCSPHRIEMAARLLRDGYFPDFANTALRLLPEWTEWCIEQSGLDGDAAARSREAARSAASELVDDEDRKPVTEDVTTPFRRPE
jgi:hypothetical protein